MSHMCDENAPQDNRPRDMRALDGRRGREMLGARTLSYAGETMSKPALLKTGPMMPLIEEGIAKAFEVHRLHRRADREALLEQDRARCPAPSAPAATRA